MPYPPGAGGPPPERPRVTVTVPPAAAGIVAAWLHLRCPAGLRVHDPETGPGDAAPGGPTRLVCWPPADAVADLVFGLGALFAALRADGALDGPTHVEVDDDPGLWARPRQVVRVGHFVVARPWLDYAPAADEVLLRLEPGPDGDDGRRPATALALLALERLAATGRRFDRVLDVRCGSGVLTLAAAALWPDATVDAVDPDPSAVARASANAARVGLRERVRVHDAATGDVPGPFALAIARASAGEQEALAPVFERIVVAGGRVVATGFPLGSVDTVERNFVARGLYCVASDALDDWAALTLAK